ncbi:hypothetical protein [Atlantibacter sp.]|uniref:hypothetical protein n=1 Tax=Atlantibacter sp. TaxID=1903473 RepID=UPI0028A92AA9|nr:hypothetical protein [Atlantibacter sp.]
MKMYELPESVQNAAADALAIAIRENGCYENKEGMAKAIEIAETIRDVFLTLYSDQ